MTEPNGDKAILDLFNTRDERALSMCRDKYGARLRALSRSVTGDSETADECENDTYLVAWQRIPPDDPGDHLFAYLARIIRCVSIDRCRRESAAKRSAVLAELTEEMEQCIPDGDTTEETVDAKLLGEAINRFLAAQPTEKQRIFTRRYFYSDPVASIAARYGMSESKVKSVLFRMRTELKKYLMKEGYQP